MNNFVSEATKLITPEEAAKLAGLINLGEIKDAKPFVMAFYDQYSNDGSYAHFFWLAACMFNAGRVAGIRSERARRWQA